MLKSTDELLYVISIKKKISWEEFNKFLELLYNRHQNGNFDENKIKNNRNKVVNFLQALGHCEFDFCDKNRKVYAAPPVLVRLPLLDSAQAILAGARTPQTINKLRDSCQYFGEHIKVVITEQPEPILTPARICIQAKDVAELQEIANVLKIEFSDTPPAWSILHFAASLEDYLAPLKWEKMAELKTLKKGTFDPIYCKFTESDTEVNTRLSEYKHPNTQQNIYYLWQEEKCAEVNRDWGRYVIFKELGINVIIYDKISCILAIPAGARPPKLLERALTLCSGYVPVYKPNLPDYKSEIRGFYLYRNIPPRMAEITAAKLGQTFSYQSLSLA